MWKRCNGLLSFALVIGSLQGCSHVPPRGNVLTEKALRRAAATCRIKTWAYKRQRGGNLPFIDIFDPDYESSQQTALTPAMACLKRELAPFRYDFIRTINS